MLYLWGGSTTNPNTGTVIRNNTFGPAAGFGADAIGKAAVIVVGRRWYTGYR
jgi:hypothetical protein